MQDHAARLGGVVFLFGEGRWIFLLTIKKQKPPHMAGGTACVDFKEIAYFNSKFKIQNFPFVLIKRRRHKSRLSLRATRTLCG
ncbi:MAG: hypothetical protein IKB14_07095, partial [Rikenellaceae bacterium]|nr:hypothetical protein [Rikenellaceae bacterium]